MFMRLLLGGFVCVLLGLAPTASPWSGHEVTEQGLRLSIPEISPVENPTMPMPLSIVVSNTRTVVWQGELRVEGLVDDWRCEGPDRFLIRLSPGHFTTLVACLRSGPFVFDALYPVHARLYPANSSTAELHAVRIFEVRRPTAVSGTPIMAQRISLRLPADRAISLRASRAHRFGWAYDNGPEQFNAQPGWTGSDSASKASLTFGQGPAADPREAIGLHVPYEGGTGRVWIEWTVDLPSTGPIELRSATALYHSGEDHRGRSDGVRCRVVMHDVAMGDAPGATVYEELCEHRHWRPIIVDLSAWTGRTVRLRLECDPGPRRNTAFDQVWWVDPVLLAGAARLLAPTGRVERFTANDTVALRERAQRIADGALRPDHTDTFALGDNAGAALQLGRAGILDGIVALAARDGGSVAFAGLEVDIEGRPAGRYPSTVLCLNTERIRMPKGSIQVRHWMADDRGVFPLDVTIRSDHGALRLSIDCARDVTLVRPAAWDRHPARVYWGHGYVVERPGENRWFAGGHSLASSHVGIEFEQGPAVLQAFDVPPSVFEVNPAQNRAALQCQMAGTFSLMVGRRPLDLAIAWRHADSRRAAPGVPRLAGRFVFDIWGGRFKQIETNLARMIRYGLTNSVLIIHNWQRWGYDYRLPDIWPPNPQIGSIEDLQRIAALARASDVLWGLHDNYIDFYPDAEGYSYRRIYFTSEGYPHRAWYNESRDALSYKWRPDAILPFVKRNTELIRAHVLPTCSFVDVFASQPCGVWYDHEGRRYTPAQMRQHWGEAFAHIREAFQGAPTISEAGHDHLVGWLDGADCQWLRLTDEPRAIFSIRTKCERWARIPWMDAAHHDRFVLYGAGYSSRFAGGRGRWHGINSDEYLAAEVLGGHPPMTDDASWGAAAVRKYWLLADIARSLAMRRIVSHEFEDGRIDRQTIRWDHGAVVCVNLGDDDWMVRGRILPPHGWWAVTPAATAAVERVGTNLVEWSTSSSTRYLSARTSFHEPHPRRLRVRPAVAHARLDGGRLLYELLWTCRQSPGRDLTVFVHLVSEPVGWTSGSIVAQDDHLPPRPTQEWSGEVRYERAMRLPTGLTGRYRLLAGLYNRWGRRPLEGADDGELRIWLATLDIRAGPDGTAVATVLPPPAELASGPRGLNPPGTTVDFGWACTDGAFRLELDGAGECRVVPLPDQPPFEIRLRTSHLRGLTDQMSTAEVEPMVNREGSQFIPLQTGNGEIRIRHDPAFHSYRLRSATSAP